MKKADIAGIVLIAGFATIIAFVLANAILGDPNDESVNVQYLDVVSSGIAQPDEELFNALAINPTVETYVGKCKDGEIWDDGANACVTNEEGAEAEEDDTTDTEEGNEGDEQQDDELTEPEE